MQDSEKTPNTHLVEVTNMPPRDRMSIWALAISILTALVLILHGYETKRFYRNSLLPLVWPFVTDSKSEDNVGIFLINHGAGSGFVTIHEYFLDGQKSTPESIVHEMEKRCFIEQTDDHTAVRRMPGETFPMAGGRRVNVLTFPNSIVHVYGAERQKEFQEFIHDKINVKYQWCSIYGECFSHCTSTSCSKPRKLNSMFTHVGDMQLRAWEYP